MSLPTLDNDDNNNNNKKKESKGLPKMDMPPIDHEDEDFSDEMPPIDGSDDLPELDDEFQGVPTEEALYKEDDDDELNEDIYGSIEEDEKSELPDIVKSDESNEKKEDDYNPDYEEDLEKEDENKFIDKKKKKLLPFGGKKSKRFVKSSDFDDRKNVLAKTKVTQLFVIAIIVILFLVGLRNTFMPNHVFTSDEIRQFAREGAGQTGFPEERGKAFVENFMDSYLTFDRSKPELLGMLSHYYGRDSFSNANLSELNMSWGFEAKQEVIVAPKVLEVELLTDYSAQYTVTAYVSDTDGRAVDGDNRIGRWLTFAVNTYYNEELDSLAITEDSPTIIPQLQIQEHASVPKGAALGTGEVNQDIYPAMSPTIDGFVEAFARASINSHDGVLQYIDNRDDITLYDGFGGSLELDGPPSNAISKVVYNTLTVGLYEVDVTVDWVDVSASQGNQQVTYESRYQMEVESHGEGKFVVTSFAPYKYYK